MNKYFLNFFSLFFCYFFACSWTSPEFEQRIQSHLILGDEITAVAESSEAVEKFPSSEALHQLLIRSLAQQGDEKKMLAAWDRYSKAFPKKEIERDLIEDMAWGVLKKASTSTSLPVRQMSFLAAFFSQDSKGVEILFQGMKDPNYAMRALAVKFSGFLRDQKLMNGIEKILRQEKMWNVRLEAIQAVGKMKIRKLEPLLREIIVSSQASEKEKELAIASLIQLWDGVNRKDLMHLKSSQRTGLRKLCAESIGYFLSEENVDLLLDLALDPQSTVRISAFQSLGILHSNKNTEEIVSMARKGILDPNYAVGISATRLLAIYAPKEGEQAFRSFFQTNQRKERLLAAAVLSHTAEYVSSCLTEQFHQEKEPVIKLNLAVGLIKQQKLLSEALAYIHDFSLTYKQPIVKERSGIFEYFSDLSLSAKNDFLLTPEIENQLIRLELFNLLAIHQAPGALEAMREFLSDRSWGISGAAAALLLTEGDASAIELVKELLKDPKPVVRFQAVLILSIWGREPEMIQILEKEYIEADWEQKVKILEALGHIGASCSVPFLLQAMEEQAQSLRLVAAIALIQTLNH